MRKLWLPRVSDSLDVVKATGVGLEHGGAADHLVQGHHEEHQVHLGRSTGEWAQAAVQPLLRAFLPTLCS